MDETAGAGATGMTMDEFVKLVAGEFDLDPASVRPDARLAADLGLDSVGVYELVLVLEDRGVDLIEEQLDQLVTVGDWYAASQRARSS